MTQAQRHITLSALIGVGIVAVIAVVYMLLEVVPEVPYSEEMKGRGIASDFQLLLNGYGGHFFHFAYFGNTVWLAIPVMLFITFTLWYRQNVERALWLFYGACIIVVTVHGYFTYRYKYTLFYLVVPLVLFYFWKWMDKEAIRKWRGWMLLLMVGLAIFNTWYFGKLKIINIGFMVFLPIVILVGAYALFRSQKYKILLKIIALLLAFAAIYTWVYPMRKGVEAGLQKFKTRTYRNYQVPYAIFNYLDSVNTDREFVLTNNSPNIYYYSNQPAVYYKGVMDYCYDISGPITEGRSTDQIKTFVADSLKCKYVLSSDYQNKFNDDFTAFLEDACTLIVRDTSGYFLYQIQP